MRKRREHRTDDTFIDNHHTIFLFDRHPYQGGYVMVIGNASEK